MWMVDGAIFLVMDLRSRRVLRYHGPGRYDPSADGVCRAEEIPDFEEYCRAVAVRIQRLLDGLSRQAIGYRVRQSARIVWAAGARGSLRASEIPWRDDEHRGTTRASRRLLRIAERWPAPLGLVGPGHRGAERTGCPREGPQGESGGEERARVPAGPSDGARTSLPM
jgi:hypothetical protein